MTNKVYVPGPIVEMHPVCFGEDYTNILNSKIKELSKAGGGTILLKPGSYRVSHIEERDNVLVRGTSIDEVLVELDGPTLALNGFPFSAPEESIDG